MKTLEMTIDDFIYLSRGEPSDYFFHYAKNKDSSISLMFGYNYEHPVMFYGVWEQYYMKTIKLTQGEFNYLSRDNPCDYHFMFIYGDIFER